MGTGYLTPETLPPARFSRRIAIPDDLQFIANVSGALLELANPANWFPYGAVSPEDAANAAMNMIYQYWESNMIGVLVPYATTNPPDGTLVCDGATYARVDYPDLYAVLDSFYIIDADYFVVPDTGGKTIIGEGTYATITFPFGQVDGEVNHTLTVAESANHNHTDLGHNHTEITAVATVINGGLEAPAAAAIPGAATTGTGSANLQSSGGGGSHNNMQPYIVLRYAIYYQ